ncbi:MAG: Flp pilus assembly complex ATPase component TadA [Elusimicrobia bacterium]|nr:Flp pilus assembly complex ATPase component TadA [Elusimicrobiota bacterium]
METNGDNEKDSLEDLLGSVDDAGGSEPTPESPVVKFVNDLVAQAADPGVEAIHIEPGDKPGSIQIRLRRVDRSLSRLEAPPGAMGAAILSRLKIMAQLDISERRLPQDGGIKVNVSGRPLSLRCATFPTVAGESATLVVMRERAAAGSLAESDAPGAVVAAVRQALGESGLVLLSSKDPRRGDEFLGAVAREIDAQSRVAIAFGLDPKWLPSGALAGSLVPQAGATVAASIRAALRLDADVLIVGELREAEAGPLLVEAAEAGATVLARVPVFDAASALQRLVDMGLDRPRLAEVFRLALCRRSSRKQGREVFEYELIQNSPELKRTLASGS